MFGSRITERVGSDGNRLLALVNVFPIRDRDDQVVGAVNIFRHNTSKSVPGLN